MVKTILIAIAVLAVAIIYGLSPVDLIPDLLLGIGQVDDILALAMTGYVVYRQFQTVFAARSPSGKDDGDVNVPAE